ncbi:MAG TPA: hypothetical protein P5538_03330 [Bacteroidales bacterium]|nr:hypothetical protein [Bacteroidales bacterium]HOL98163.1 hypothetical protein [Bacteroidales bacterium]HOM36521.1 hypothetical protein [Bacteroidales bacterium]HPD23939.1 hypothetical protein [Bacteroidales bacterium]HRS99919.1 hypothetical protein [Bacteroidales bacterium]
MKKLILVLTLLLSFVLQDFGQYFCTRLEKSFDPIYAPFYHGVASGDPLHVIG